MDAYLAPIANLIEEFEKLPGIGHKTACRLAFHILNHLKYCTIASNIGDIRTLVIHPWSTLYMHSSPEEAADAGVYDDTIRVSVGIEDPADLADDFAQAIKAE